MCRKRWGFPLTMSLIFSLMNLSRSEMAFIYVTSTNLVDIEFSYI